MEQGTVPVAEAVQAGQLPAQLQGAAQHNADRHSIDA
jgi:hypothetical protein